MPLQIIRLLFFLCWCLPGLALAATSDATAVSPQGTGSKLFTFQWTAPAGTSDLKGYRIYLNDALLCETSNPAATAISCKADLPPAIMTFAMTAVNADNSETGFSNTLTYNGSASPDAGGQEPKAKIAANIVTGPAPLTVTFDGAASTGGVTGYRWDFGDGLMATTATASHTYAAAGTYTASLTVVNSAGATNTATVVITAANSNSSAAAGAPPTAVISSSAATGAAPLTVTFNGLASTAVNAAITSYSWSFGDGASGTGATTSHTYMSAGTYTASLTVIDSKGQSNRVGTPIVVTAAGAKSKPPQAVISATPATGFAPLTVTFNGGGSIAGDGSISTYVWSFGDGGTATGKSVTHTYTTAGTYIAALQVTDSQGLTGAASIALVVNANLSATDVKIETGEVAVSSGWVRVPLTTPFTNPIVVAGPPSFNNADPCTIRIRNVDRTGFDIKITEWDYLDGIHPQETVSYLVMEKGRATLPDGTAVEAGSFTGAASFKTVPFASAFAKSPVVLTTVTTMNDAKTVSGRLKAITTSGFAYLYQEQEKNISPGTRNPTPHLAETVHYIAWEPGSGMLGTLQYAAVKTTNSVTDAWYSEKYQKALNQPPLLLADMQTTNDASPAALRVRNQTATGFQIKVEAERSKNSKTKHSAETVGTLILDQQEQVRGH